VVLLAAVVLMWAFREQMGIGENELGVLFSGLAFGAVAATLFVQLGELRSQRESSDETLRQLTSQTESLQDQLLHVLAETRIAELNRAVAALVAEGKTGMRALEQLRALPGKSLDDLSWRKQVIGLEDVRNAYRSLKALRIALAAGQAEGRGAARALVLDRVVAALKPIPEGFGDSNGDEQ